MEWRNVLIFDDINSADYDIYVLDAKINNGVERDVESISVPGRNGDIHIDNGRYLNLTVPYTCAIVDRADDTLQAFFARLASKIGYKRLEDSFHPEYFRQARFLGAIEPRMFAQRNKGVFDLTFDCKPQKFLKEGEKETAISGTTTFYNPTLFPAKPLIKITGTGTIAVGASIITVSQNPGNMVIDCDIEDAYNSQTKQNYNSYISVTDGKFPELPSGNTNVIATGLTASVIPRWWTV